MLKAMMAVTVLGGALLAGPAVLADETVIHRDDPQPSIVVPLPIPQPTQRETVIEHRRDCESKTVHKENDAGDSETVRKERCD